MAKTKTKSDDPRREALALALEQVQKQFGEGIIRRLGDTAVVEAPCIPSGSINLDLALGGKGFPRGRIVEVFGPESSGKTTLSLHVAANAQKLGGTVAYVDVEHSLDPTWARTLGVDVDNLLLSQPDYGEQALEIADLLVKSAAVDLIVVDSVAALVPKAEIEGEMIDQQVGLQARLMSKALRKITASVHRANALVIFINQIREKIGVTWGSPETTPGGRALKFYSSIRCDIRRLQQIKDGSQNSIGNHIRVKVVKNKVAPPFRTAEFEIMFNAGISRLGELLNLGADQRLIKKSGTWLSYGELRLGQGREAARQFLAAHPDVADKLEAEIRAHLATAAAPRARAAGADEGDAAPEGEG